MTEREGWYVLSAVAEEYRNRDGRWYQMVARLKPGVTIEQAQTDLDNLATALEERYRKRTKSCTSA
jgi:hypothetical protein